MSYPATSPYYYTDIVNEQYLDFMVNRSIITDSTDALWTITATYDLRPDLLAYDLYEDSRLWWVFAQRNPNILVDPLFDFREGVNIYIPPANLLRQSLGL